MFRGEAGMEPRCGQIVLVVVDIRTERRINLDRFELAWPTKRPSR